MNPVSQLIERGLRLGPPLTRDLTVERDLPVPMPDGTVLLADRWAPRAGGDKLPVALLRSPYGLATLDWVIRQPWFGDSIVLTGVSYLGYVQWAVAGQLPPQVKAMIPQLTESALTLDFLRADAFSLETPFGWGVLIAGQERRLGMLRGVLETGKTRRALATRPLADADLAALGQRSRYLQDILAHDADDPYWAAINHRDRVAATAVPVSSVAGWYDIFLPGQLRDFGVLQAAGRPARLTVGPWTHLSMDGTPLRETLEFGLACARGEQPPPRAPVRRPVGLPRPRAPLGDHAPGPGRVTSRCVRPDRPDRTARCRRRAPSGRLMSCQKRDTAAACIPSAMSAWRRSASVLTRSASYRACTEYGIM